MVKIFFAHLLDLYNKYLKDNGFDTGEGRFVYGIDYKEKPNSINYKTASLTMRGEDSSEMYNKISEEARKLKEQEGWAEYKITMTPQYDKGGNVYIDDM